MHYPMTRVFNGALLLMVPLMVTNCERCGKHPDDPVLDTDTDPPQVEVALQVVSMDPHSLQEGMALDASVYGAGFVSGARVDVGQATGLTTEVLDANTLSVRGGAQAVGTWDVTVTNPDGSSSVLRRGLTVVAKQEVAAGCADLVVYFDFDKAGLTDEATRLLSGAGSCLQGGKGELRLEGHADERGTTEYNLGLGQRRADAVRQHLSGLGVSSTRMRTVSFGEERPLDPAHGESAWARNRRVEVHVSN
ncbi:MAG: OmpA family protein [Deltaproteobacteria bacterium]|nr:OmpA family protein [Deltaproteobacteria bacterium]